ncbi:hypothetical protein D3C84_652830 [compost metagenome]
MAEGVTKPTVQDLLRQAEGRDVDGAQCFEAACFGILGGDVAALDERVTQLL